MSVKVRYRLDCGVVPTYATAGSAGADVYAVLDEPLVIRPGEVVLVPTGVYLEIPEGYEAQVRARSSLAARGIIVANSPGTIDSDYRGEVKVILANISREDQVIYPHERVAQLVFAPVVRARFSHADELSGTSRGSGGFGSTGR